MAGNRARLNLSNMTHGHPPQRIGTSLDEPEKVEPWMNVWLLPLGTCLTSFSSTPRHVEAGTSTWPITV
ncbi:MAG: hypothetical protein Q8N08_09625 [Methanobacteriaceae archaeon]|nr:hypothetical protein [Methanobacteriaceae archaeon]